MILTRAVLPFALLIACLATHTSEAQGYRVSTPTLTATARASLTPRQLVLFQTGHGRVQFPDHIRGDRYATYATIVANINSATERLAKATRQRSVMVPGVNNDTIRTAIVGLTLALIYLPEIESQPFAYRHQNAGPAIRSLLSGPLDYLAHDNSRFQLSNEAVEGLAELVSVFANAEIVRTPNIAQAFLNAAERQAMRLHGHETVHSRYEVVEAYLERLSRACVR